jgi:hypothetical protein
MERPLFFIFVKKVLKDLLKSVDSVGGTCIILLVFDGNDEDENKKKLTKRSLK